MAELFELHDRARRRSLRLLLRTRSTSELHAPHPAPRSSIGSTSAAERRRSRRTDRRGRHRHPGRRQRPHPRCPHRRVRPPPGADPGQLAGLSRHHGHALSSLHHRRRLRSSRRTSELYYSEKVLRLPCYQPNDRKRASSPQSRRAAPRPGCRTAAFVFCCFNGTHKISRFTFERWLDILQPRAGQRAVAAGRRRGQPRSACGDFAEQRRHRAASGWSSRRKCANPEHLARYPLADLFLDTAPYGAHTTASDALWMGVPVLTLSGRCFASRVCGSLVRAAGLPDLVCASGRTMSTAPWRWPKIRRI